MTTTNGMRIVEITIENIKRIEAVNIRPDGNMIVIGGDNANGKSSILDSIMYVLGGKSFIPTEPLRRGTKKGFARLDLGELVAERRVTKSGTEIAVTSKDGAKYPSPQAILNALFESKDKTGSQIFFDPTKFVGMDAKAQMELLKRVLGVSFDDLDARYSKLYEERTGVNREAKLLEGQVNAMPRHDEAKEPVDTQALTAELQQAEKQNKVAELADRELETLATVVAGSDAELNRMRARAEVIKNEQATARARMAEVAEKAIEPIDVSAITDKLINAQELNDKVEANERRKKAEKQFRAKNLQSEELTLAIEKIVEEKENRLSEAQFPVPGLSFSEDGVLLNGLPFNQASSAEQLKVSVALGLAMHPKLKVLLIRDGSLLDESSLALLEQMAEENDAQVFVERVSKGKEVSVIIQNGLVAEKAVA